MRVYVPLTFPALREAHRAGELAPGSGGTVAYAVTPGLREWCGSDDGEELEYAALGRAARASLRLLAGEPEAPRRRVVVALDVADGVVSFGPGPGPGPDSDHASDRESLGEVRIEGPLPLSKAAAVHVDAGEAEADVTAAAGALGAAAGAGDGDARFAADVDGAEDHELLWYATQEIPHLTD